MLTVSCQLRAKTTSYLRCTCFLNQNVPRQLGFFTTSNQEFVYAISFFVNERVRESVFKFLVRDERVEKSTDLVHLIWLKFGD